MGVEIFYFSATGNSLVVARDIAKRFQGKLTPITSVVDAGEIQSEADVVGIIFPIHNVANGGIPPIIRRFISRIRFHAKQYIFAVCTCGAGSGVALSTLATMVKSAGGQVAAGFTVKMPFNCPPFTRELEQQKRFHDWQQKLDDICTYVSERKTGRIERVSKYLEVFTAPLAPMAHAMILKNYRNLANAPDLSFDDAVAFVDNSYSVDENCDGCGICARVCPVDNISIADNKATWKHHCESCLACLVWCPHKAIHGGLLSGRAQRYHHPDVKLADMFKYHE